MNTLSLQNESIVSKRIVSIDVTRGLVMVIMAIDHIRDLMHTTSQFHNALDFNYTHTTLFLTRWITHLCAPTFVFLSGVSAYLSMQRSTNVKSSRTFLFKRGIWLIILEFTVITFGLWADIYFRTLMFQVIAAIGLSFIFLSLLSRLKTNTILIIGVIIIFTHDLITTSINHYPQNLKMILTPLFAFNVYPLANNRLFLLAYPVIPWLGIMLTGYGCGKLFTKELNIRKKYFLIVSFTSIILFLVLRFPNLYGEVAPWSHQSSTAFTILSFINVSKYPPSLQYTLVMLGISFFILFMAESINNILTRILAVYGKVPMFYYLCHLYLIHISMFLVLFAEGFKTKQLMSDPTSFGRPAVPNGVSLQGVYIVWLILMVILYPLCKWYNNYRIGHPEKKWLRYI